MTNEISNCDDVIDSRDIIERIKELSARRAPVWIEVEGEYKAEYNGSEMVIRSCGDGLCEVEVDGEILTASEPGAEPLHFISSSAAIAAALEAVGFDAADALDDDEADELKALEALASEAEDYAADWAFGATLIRDSYFTDYAEELVKDIGDLPDKISSYIVIDWEATAGNLKADYTSVDFDGVAYWVR